MSIYNRDFKYAETRLKNIILKTKSGTPIIVKEIYENGRCVVEDLVDFNKLKIINFKKLNLSFLTVGYVNCGEKTFYIVNYPKAGHYKHGLDLRNCHSIDNKIKAKDLPTKAIVNSLVDNYPTIKEIIEDNYIVHHAWNKNWSVNKKNQSIYFKDILVGNIDGIKPVLDYKFNFLEDLLNESIRYTI